MDWCKWSGGHFFCAPKNRGLHKILQPFLERDVFLCIPVSFLQKRSNTEGINNNSNINIYSDCGKVNQHNMVYSSPTG